MPDETTTQTRIKTIFTWAMVVLFLSLAIYACNAWKYPIQRWVDVQSSGGIRIGYLEEKNGKLMLPIQYDITGHEKITVVPTRTNHELMIEDILVRRQNDNIILTIRGAPALLVAKRADVHYANLPELPTGTYNVYYEDIAINKFLGKVEVK
jgi:hypothetical protein